MPNYDVVVVGGGLGGLVAATELAVKGVKVLLLEQGQKLGGCAQGFQHKEFYFDVGLHQIDGPDNENTQRQEMFVALGIDQRLEFVPLKSHSHVVVKSEGSGFEMTIPAELSEFVHQLAQRWPEEKNKFEDYFQQILGLRKESLKFLSAVDPAQRKKTPKDPSFAFKYPLLSRYQFSTLQEFIDPFKFHPLVQLVLTSSRGFYHHRLDQLSLVYYALSHGSFLQNKPHYIKGGSTGLVQSIVERFKASGGEFILGANVDRVISGEKHRVEYNVNGSDRYEEVSAVVFSCSLPQVVKNICPELSKLDAFDKIENLEVGPSVTNIYHGLKSPLKNSHYLRNHFNLENELCFTIIDNQHVPLNNFSDPTLVVSFLDSYDQWSGLSLNAQALKKEQLKTKINKELSQIFPDFQDKMAYCSVSTPLTLERYTKNERGAAYGFSPTPGQSGWNRPQNFCEIPGLFFASAWAIPGGGFSGAMLSGHIASGLATDYLRARANSFQTFYFLQCWGQ